VAHCEDCQRDLPVDAFYLKNGRINSPLCKDCTCEDHKLRRRDPEAHRIKAQERREARKARKIEARPTHKPCTQCGVDKELGEFREKERGLYGRSSWCRECERQYTLEWTDANRDAHNERRREAWKARDWTPEERAIEAARMRAWYAQNRARHKQTFYRWVKDNRDAYNAIQQKRRAQKSGVDATLTSQEWKEILAAHDRSCAYCDTSSETMTMDHVVPLSKGGAHAKENVVPACRSCNSRKGARPVEVMMQESSKHA
jgi:5-methylcytosine-specific restriction endonuclease McrA